MMDLKGKKRVENEVLIKRVKSEEKERKKIMKVC